MSIHRAIVQRAKQNDVALVETINEDGGVVRATKGDVVYEHPSPRVALDAVLLAGVLANKCTTLVLSYESEEGRMWSVHYGKRPNRVEVLRSDELPTIVEVQEACKGEEIDVF